MGKIKVTDAEKKQRLMNFLTKLDSSIRRNVNFSFTAAISENKITWSVNALSVRAIMIDLDLVQQSSYSKFAYVYTDRGKNMELDEMCEIIFVKTFAGKDYLEGYISDVEPGTIGEPMTEEEEREMCNKDNIVFTDQSQTLEIVDKIVKKVKDKNNGFIVKQKEIIEFKKLENFDEIELGVIRYALRKVVNNPGESKIYTDLANELISRIK